MTLVIVAVAVIGTLSLKSEPETIQGQIEVAEYRVSSKVPGASSNCASRRATTSMLATHSPYSTRPMCVRR